MDIIIRDDKKELTEKQKKKKKNQTALLTLSEAKIYLAKSLKTYRLIGIGVWLILVGVSSVVALGNIGIFSLFLTIGLAVILFLVAGTQMSEFEQIEGMPIRLDKVAYQIIQQEKNALQFKSHFKIGLGVALILLAVGGIAALGLSPAVLLLTVGFSVFLFITSGASIGTFDHLLSQGDYAKFGPYPLLESKEEMLEQGTIIRQISVEPEPSVESSQEINENLLTTNTTSAALDDTNVSQSADENDLTAIKKATNTFISQLYAAKNSIDNSKSLGDIDEIIDLTNKIVYRLEKEPSLISSTRRLFEYYLPTTVKLVVNYGDIKKQGISGTNIDSMISSIEEALSNLTHAYKSQLEKLYLHTSVDLEAEIVALESMLRKEGLLADDNIPSLS